MGFGNVRNHFNHNNIFFKIKIVGLGFKPQFVNNE